MIFYQTETLIGLIIASIPAIISAFLYFKSPYKKEALWFLLISAFLVRLLMIMVDPYLQDWDERFHALVAKNMITHPFKPMLYTHPVLPYNYTDWWHSHIWVHKQPLFLWQMAISMKIFGITPFALRIPSLILGTIAVKLVYDIAQRWTRQDTVAYFSAFCLAFGWYGLEMTAGWMSLDHNDFTFFGYITAGIWAWVKYLDSPNKLKWAILTGVSIGCAILIKWLTAFFVFGGWGLYVLLQPDFRKKIRTWLHLGFAFLVSLVVSMPWQLYIMHRFPEESAWSYEYNRLHITKDLGHDGPWHYHLSTLPYFHTWAITALTALGLILILFSKKADRKLTWSMLAMIVVLIAFFSFVATKMPGFIFPLYGLMWILVAAGLVTLIDLFFQKPGTRHRNNMLLVCLLVVGFIGLQPWRIVAQRSENHGWRNEKIHNTAIIKGIPQEITCNYVILHFWKHHNIEYMFHHGGTAYEGIPNETTIDSLQHHGHRLAVVNYEGLDSLPLHITADPRILKINSLLK